MLESDRQLCCCFPSSLRGCCNLVLPVQQQCSCSIESGCKLCFWLYRNKTDFCEDIREQYKEMRDEFMAGLEDRKYLTIDQVRKKALQV